MVKRRLVLVVFSAMTCVSAFAQDTKNFFVAPISTDLQRAIISSSADTYAIANCNPFVVDGSVELSALDREAFVTNLADALPNRQHLFLVCRYQLPANIDAKLRKQIQAQLSAICRIAGYEKVSLSETMTSRQWQQTLDAAASFDEPFEATESLVEDEHVRVFPVRTRLSKFVLGDTDCIVEINRPIDGRVTEISSQLKSSISENVQSIALARKQNLLFKLSSTSAGRHMVEKLFDPRLAPVLPSTDDPALLEVFKSEFESQIAAYKPSPALALALELGFKSINFSHSPGGGAPEALIGKEAPNFKLTRLNGEPLDLHEFINGRPALVTFWGLACGPCRQEAPHLSKLWKKYAPHDFSMVAVNGYNDEREAVAKYVETDGLSHPIVLQGRSVADDLYSVGAYPTTFWINRQGKVTDYEVGFTSVEHLERHIKEMLGNQH